MAERGWQRKYDVRRLNDPDGKHSDCEFFVLDLEHDEHAPAALLAYADACEAQRPELAADIRRRFEHHEGRLCFDPVCAECEDKRLALGEPSLRDTGRASE